MKHWVIVADAGSCKVYETNASMKSFVEVRSLTNERIHLHVADLVTDKRGSMQSRPGGERTSFDAPTDPHEAERVRFAGEVADMLEASQDQWEHLVIAAPPKFLGDLRAHLSEQVAKRVVASIHHDYVKTPVGELPERISSHLPGTPGMNR